VYDDSGDYDDATWSIHVNEAPKPDLVISDIAMSDSTVYAGDSVDLDFWGNNITPGTTSVSNVQMKAYWGTSQNSKSNYIGTEYFGSINGLDYNENEKTTIFGWTIPTLSPGTYWITAEIDTDNKQDNATTENDANNLRSESFTVLEAPKPDLRVISLTASSTTVIPGDDIEIDAVVKNYDLGNAPKSQIGYFWGSTAGSRQTYIGQGNIPNVGMLGYLDESADSPTNAAQGEPNFVIPDVGAGTYYITAVADYKDNKADESDETNNERSIAITVVSPDLIVEAIWVNPDTVTQGQGYKIKARVKNQGNAEATAGALANQEIYFYVDGVFVGEDNYDDLAAGASITLESPTLTGPTAGPHTIRAKADANNEVNEGVREGNNERSEPITVMPSFHPYFDDARIGGRVDRDNDGYMRRFDVEFDVDSNIPGTYYVEIWEDDPSIAGWGDDYIGRSSVLMSEGSDDIYFSYPVVTEAHGLSLGEAEFVLKLYDATIDELVQIWHKADDSDLGGVLVEYEYQDADRATAIDYLAQALRNVLDVGPRGDHPLFNLGASFEIGHLVKVLAGVAAPAPPVAAAVFGIGTVLDFLNTNVHFGLTVDLADLLFDANLDPWTKDGVDGYVTCFLTGGATLVDLSTGADLPVNVSLSTAPAKNALASYYGEPNVGGGTILELTGSYGSFSASVSVDTEGISTGAEYDLLPTSWDFGGGLEALTFDHPFLAFDLHVSVFRAITLGMAFGPFFDALVDIFDSVGDGIRVLPDDPAQFSLTDILIAKWTGQEAPDLVRPAWPDTQGELRNFSGGIDANGDDLGDGYYPAILAGEVPAAVYPYLTGLDVANTGFQKDDFFVQVKEVPPNWFVEADDGWPSDMKYDVTDVPAGGHAATRWVIAPYEGAADEELVFHLYHDRFGFWANEYLQSLEVPVHVGQPELPPTAYIDAITPNPAQPPSQVINFDGHGTDINGTVLAWEWRSDHDGLLSTAEDFTKPSLDLTVGEHEISFRVRDEDGLWSEPTTSDLIVNNALPTAEMFGVPSEPVQGGSTIHLTLGGHDNDENGQSIVAGELRLDGNPIANPMPGMYPWQVPVAPGNYLLAYRVRDDEGALSNPVSASLDVRESTPPVVTGVILNQQPGRTVSAIEPSGIGVQTIEITFSEPVNFNDGSVTVEAYSDGGPLTPQSPAGSGTNTMTIAFDNASVVDTWAKVTLHSGAITDLDDNALDGEPSPGGTGRCYIYDAAVDLPTGDGTAGGDAVFFVGSLRGDCWGDDFFDPEPNGQITALDVDGFIAAYRADSLDADFWGDDFFDPAPNGQITALDMDGFIAAYRREAWLEPLPVSLSSLGLASEPAVALSASLSAPSPMRAPETHLLLANLQPPSGSRLQLENSSGSIELCGLVPVDGLAGDPSLRCAHTPTTLQPAHCGADAASLAPAENTAPAHPPAETEPSSVRSLMDGLEDESLVDVLALATEAPLDVTRPC